MITDIKYKIYPIEWSPEYEREIQAVYQMFKDQESRIFDLAAYDGNTSIMDLVEEILEENRVFIVTSNDDIMASFVLGDAVMFGNIITEVNIHCAIRRPFWGPTSREICKAMKEYLDKHYLIKKLIAEVPQCKYGIIKLLKDIGFKHEGTLKECLLYLDKNNKPKWYDKLIYTSTRKDI